MVLPRKSSYYEDDKTENIKKYQDDKKSEILSNSEKWSYSILFVIFYTS